ncbi:MAG: alkane 1-monooxygenase [Gammaproteobacteria bacterium]
MMDYLRYYLCTLIVLAGIAGCALGGQWMWLGIATYPILGILDLLLGKDHKPRRISMPNLADLPLYIHVVLMVVLYATFSWRIGTGVGAEGMAGAAATFGGFISLAWLSAVPGVPVAHELMHRHGAIPRLFAKIGSAFFADMNRDIAHLNTHHIHFDTPRDSDTAYRGENVYTFMWRATKGSYIDAWETEKRRMKVKGKTVWAPQSLVVWAIILVLAIAGGCAIIGGPLAGLLSLLAMLTSKFMLEALNYLQHYGLLRVEGVAMEKRHTWNHLSTVSRAIGYEITTHIDHHKNGDLRFDQLVPYPDAPQMPSIFICGAMAFIPPLWNPYIQRRLREWDQTFANQAELDLARKANLKAGWPDWFGTTHEGAPA